MKLKTILFLTFIFSMTMTFSQERLSEENAKIIIGEFFRGFHEADTTRMNTVIADNMLMQTLYVTKEGENKVIYSNADGLKKMVASRPADQKWDERLLGYSVLNDGNLAHVWTPYEFWLNDTFSHCGANSFVLAYTDDGWRIINIADSRRLGSCDYYKEQAKKD